MAETSPSLLHFRIAIKEQTVRAYKALAIMSFAGGIGLGAVGVHDAFRDEGARHAIHTPVEDIEFAAECLGAGLAIGFLSTLREMRLQSQIVTFQHEVETLENTQA